MKNPEFFYVSKKETAFYVFSVLLVFALGFFIFHGKEAAQSGSWKYVITHHDEYSYWAYAKGMSETPPSDGNPFFYEDRGLRHSVPYTTANLVGILSKIFHLPILFFFPVWHIGMPFLSWLALFLCLWRIWKYPPFPSALSALFVLTITLFLAGPVQFTLFRFSRPGDGIGVMAFWLSLIMNFNPISRKQCFLIGALSFASFWLHPFYILPGVVVTVLESIRLFFKNKRSKSVLLALSSFGGVALGVLSYFIYLKTNGGMINRGLITDASIVERISRNLNLIGTSMGLCAGVFFFSLIFKRLLKRPLSRLDWLTFFILWVAPLATIPQLFLKNTFTMQVHLYYFFIIECFCLLGLACQNIPPWVRSVKFKKREWLLVLIGPLGGFFFMKNPGLNLFLYGHPGRTVYDNFDNAVQLFWLIIFIALGAWGYARFQGFFRKIFSKISVWTLVCGVTLLGFFLLPHQITSKNFPFDGAYRWLDRNASKGSVVLSATTTLNEMPDYLLLYTSHKPFLNSYGFRLSPNGEASFYRFFFLNALLLGKLDEIPMAGLTTLEEKLSHLKLDYILIKKKSPFLKKVQDELAGHIQEVYQDETSLVWKVFPRKQEPG